MKNKLVILALAALLTLGGCGSEVSDNSVSTDETSSTTRQSSADESSSTVTTSVSDSASETQSTTSLTTSETSESVTSTSGTSPTSETTTTTTSAATTASSSAAQKVTTSPRIINSDDRTKPVIFKAGTLTYHKLGTPFDLNKYVGYGDDTDRHPKLTYTGSVDPNKAGDYTIRATVTDASGNSTSWDLTVRVTGSVPKTSQNIPSMPFESFIAKYKTSGTRIGIDVSQWQGSIDFSAVKNAGCSFVFIRVGTKLGGYTLDPYFRTNLNNAIAAGLDVGVYLYTTDHTEASARDSARWIVSQLGGKKLTMPAAFDWEETDDFQKLGASTNDVNNAFLAFKDELARNGCSAMIYAMAPALTNLWSKTVKDQNPVWLADYVEKTTYSGNYGIWQVGYGRIPGIGVITDFNVLYTDKRYK